MKITRRQLRRIVREELESSISNNQIIESLADRISRAWDEFRSEDDTGDTGFSDSAGRAWDEFWTPSYEDIPWADLRDKDADATEEEAQKEAEEKNIQFFEGLPAGIKFVYASNNPKGEARVYDCTASGCQAYVNDMLRPGKENRPSAWWSHYVADRSVFNDNIQHYKSEVEDLFTEMTNTPSSEFTVEKDEYFQGKVTNIVSKMIPSVNPGWKLELGDEVGLWYGGSTMKTTSFFEGATGYSGYWESCGMKKIHKTFLVRQSDGKPWHPEMMPEYCEREGKAYIPDSKFIWSPRLAKSFGFNTHVGFVGAIRDGEPIIFHNIAGVVVATPISSMHKSGCSIVWLNKGGK